MNRIRFAFAIAALLGAPHALAQVTVSEAWARGTVAGQRATGAFMKLVAAEDVVLVGAASPIAASVEIHEMKMDGGVMKMRAIDRLRVPKGTTVVLEPGGYHVMLMGLKRSVTANESVPITLTFESANGKRSTVEVAAPVKALAAGHGAMK